MGLSGRFTRVDPTVAVYLYECHHILPTSTEHATFCGLSIILFDRLDDVRLFPCGEQYERIYIMASYIFSPHTVLMQSAKFIEPLRP